MARKRTILLFSLLLAALFSGCATGPKTIDKTASVHPVEIKRTALLQSAMDALDVDNNALALEAFDKMLKKREPIPSELLYAYGTALSEATRYQDAIRQLTIYIETLGRRGPDFLAALEGRTSAEQKFKDQLEKKTKTEQAEASYRQFASSQEANWQVVKVQTDNRATSFTEPLTGIEMILINGGCYLMGDQFGDGEKIEQPVHEICLDDFYLGKFEVTQEQWQKVMGANPSKQQQGGQYPVDMVSWQDAMAFTKALSGDTGFYRLPTEAEWEYAARSGGKKEKFSGGNNVDAVAWHEDNSDRSSHPVGQKQPNGLGLYDMSGNVYERCLDFFTEDYYSSSAKQNPGGAANGSRRVLRGGSWDSQPAYSRTSFRIDEDRTGSRQKQTGFRLALPVAGQ